MSRSKTFSMRAVLTLTFVCLLMHATPSAAVDDGSLLQGLRTRVEAMLRLFVAPHPAVSDRSEESVGVQNKSRSRKKDDTDGEVLPPPSRQLMDMDPGG